MSQYSYTSHSNPSFIIPPTPSRGRTPVPETPSSFDVSPPLDLSSMRREVSTPEPSLPSMLRWMRPAMRQLPRLNIQRQREDQLRFIFSEHPEYLLLSTDLTVPQLALIVLEFPLGNSDEERKETGWLFSDEYGLFDYIVSITHFRGNDVRTALEHHLVTVFKPIIINLGDDELMRRGNNLLSDRHDNFVWDYQ